MYSEDVVFVRFSYGQLFHLRGASFLALLSISSLALLWIVRSIQEESPLLNVLRSYSKFQALH